MKPKAKVIGQDGNVFNLLAICCKALKDNDEHEKQTELRGRVFSAKSYDEALRIMGEYCELI
jgi:hypothetical protein